jgi:hypothetical protein
MRSVLCFDQIEAAFNPEKPLVEAVHPMFETYKIGASTGKLRFHPNELIFNRTDPSRNVMESLQEGIDLRIDPS